MADLSRDTLLFGKEFRRMCNSFFDNGEYRCKECVLYQGGCLFGSADECDENDEYLLQVVQQWHDEHQPRTYAQDFREKFPSCAWRDDKNYPKSVCVNLIYKGFGDCNRADGRCKICWNEPMSEE